MCNPLQFARLKQTVSIKPCGFGQKKVGQMLPNIIYKFCSTSWKSSFVQLIIECEAKQTGSAELCCSSVLCKISHLISGISGFLGDVLCGMRWFPTTLAERLDRTASNMKMVYKTHENVAYQIFTSVHCDNALYDTANSCMQTDMRWICQAHSVVVRIIQSCFLFW